MSDSKFLIIAGTEKAGTTSLFQYLVDTKRFNPSFKKETDYLRNINCSSQNYLACNFPANSSKKCNLEASPGYLTDSKIVSKNIIDLKLHNSVLVFILRSPIKRLISNFVFRKSRMHIDQSITFDEYVSKCFKYNNGTSPSELGMTEWCLKALDGGLYYKHLNDFLKICPKNCLIFEFEEFVMDPKEHLVLISDKIGEEFSNLSEYKFEMSNVTFSARNKSFQKIALSLNSNLETFFYQHPRFKKLLLNTYKKINSSKKENVKVNDENRKKLFDFYRVDIESLFTKKIIDFNAKEKWFKDFGC